MRSATSSRRFGFLDTLIVLAALATAGVHVHLAVSPTSPEPQLRGTFLLAAVGFLGAVAALYAPLGFLEPVRWVARLALLGVTVATIVGYFVVVGFSFDMLAIVDKSVEGVLVVALVLDGARARARAGGVSGRRGRSDQAMGGRLAV